MKNLNDLKAAHKKLGEEIEALESKPDEFMYVDQPVMAFSGGLRNIRYRSGENKVFINGRSGYYCDHKNDGWDKINPDINAPSIPNWIQNTGVEPKIEGDYLHVTVIFRDGDSNEFRRVNTATWPYSGCMSDIMCYCIIRAPEMIKP